MLDGKEVSHLNQITRTALLLLTLPFTASVCSAQAEKPSQATPSPVEASPKEWKEFTSAEGRFSAMLPGTPVGSAESVDTDAGKLTLHVFSLLTLPAYAVEYTDFPVSIEDPARVKQALDGGRDGGVKNVKGTLLEEKEVSLGGHPGRYIKVRAGSGSIIRSQIYAVGNRVYTVVFVTSEDVETAATLSSYEGMAAKFFDSFKLLPATTSAGGSKQAEPTLAAPEGVEVDPAIADSRKQPTETEGEVDRLLKSLREKGEAVYTPSSSPAPAPTLPSAKSVSSVEGEGRVISKPQPLYPPIAKAARAQGTVVVQIVIDEEGKVIAAQALSGNPLLQAAAVKASREARFSPIHVEGKPVKVVGTISYNFALK